MHNLILVPNNNLLPAFKVVLAIAILITFPPKYIQIYSCYTEALNDVLLTTEMSPGYKCSKHQACSAINHKL